MPLIHVLRGKLLPLLLLVLVVSIVLGVGAKPAGWPEGWSGPVQVGTGVRNQGYTSAPLGVDALLLATVMGTTHETVLQVERVDIKSKRSAALLNVPVDGLVSFMLFSHENVGKLGYLSRREGVSQVYVQNVPSMGEAAQEPILITETTGLVADFTAAISSQGNTFFAWSNNEWGLRSIHLQGRDPNGVVLWEHYIDSPHTVDTTPVLAVDQDRNKLYLLHREGRGAAIELVYTVFDVVTGESTLPLSLGRVGQDAQQTPTLLINDDNSVDIVWAKETLARGQVRGTEVSMGTLSSLGQWISPLSTLSAQEGSNAALGASRRGDTVIVWLNDASGSFQINHVALNHQGEVLSQGPVTVGNRQRFSPQVHWVGEYRAVLFQEVDAQGLRVFLVDDMNPAKPPLAFWLGLDLEAPLIDGIFRYFSLAVAAVTLGCLAAVGLAVAVGSILLGKSMGLVRSSELGLPLQLALIFAILSLLKRSGTFLYFGAVSVGGPIGTLIALGSAVFAIVALRLGDMDEADTLTLALGGFLFVVSDAFCSLYVRGLGQW